MRWVVACAIVLASVPAAARRPTPHVPAIARACPRAATFAAIETCVKRLGKLTVERELPGARLVRVEQVGEGYKVDLGLALYVEREHEWQVGGVYEARGRDYELLEAAPVVAGKHAGYRIEVGELAHRPVTLDGITTQPAVYSTRRALLCAGDTFRCTEVIAACDVFVRGAAVWTFHGTLSIAENEVHVAGDRKNTGTFCAVPETQLLGWRQP